MDAYAVLGVARGASEEEIRRAYQRLARVHHPDRKVEGDYSIFIQLQAAYEQLRETSTRQQHDASLHLEELANAQAAARATTVDLSEMEYSEDAEGRGLWTYDCRCLLLDPF